VTRDPLAAGAGLSNADALLDAINMDTTKD
jgi:hypothetical protein